jgi:hypothetical protein
MKLSALILLSVAVATISVAQASKYDTLIDALIAVESRGNASAIGDNGRAYGILQIHAVMVADANRIAKTTYTHDDMFEPAKSRAVANIIISHYARHIERTTGVPATDEQLARVWNGGGSAWKKPQAAAKENNLERYWRKVSKEIK